MTDPTNSNDHDGNLSDADWQTLNAPTLAGVLRDVTEAMTEADAIAFYDELERLVAFAQASGTYRETLRYLVAHRHANTRGSDDAVAAAWSELLNHLDTDPRANALDLGVVSVELLDDESPTADGA